MDSLTPEEIEYLIELLLTEEAPESPRSVLDTDIFDE